MLETKTFFIGEEEFDYTVNEENGKFVGKTSFDSRLTVTANSLNEVYDILQQKIKQLTRAS
jgi:hypothetical protein